MQEPKVIFETDAIKVSVLQSPQGAQDDTLISFTGVGHALGGLDVQKPEFFKAHQWYRTMIFVSDLKRTWGNGVDFDALRKAIEPFVEGTQVDTLGNSMGGFLALLMPEKMPVRRAVAIVPQISLHPDIVPWETRWLDYRSQIKTWIYANVADHFVEQTEYVVAFGAHKKDLKHMHLLPERSNLDVLQAPNLGHTLANDLKKIGLLEVFVGALLQNEAPGRWFAAEFLPMLHEKNCQP